MNAPIFLFNFLLSTSYQTARMLSVINGFHGSGKGDYDSENAITPNPESLIHYFKLEYTPLEYQWNYHK